MQSPLDSSISIVAYLALFGGVGFAFVFVNLLLGRFLRPSDPHQEKLEIYECGEPTIGSSFVQFDLRFYVVALVFIIFDVEVAFLFPWAAFFGKTMNFLGIADQPAAIVETAEGGQLALTKDAGDLLFELGVAEPFSGGVISAAGAANLVESAEQLAGVAIIEVLVFFTILLIAFAYVWSSGALDWVRAISQERTGVAPRGREDVMLERETSLSA